MELVKWEKAKFEKTGLIISEDITIQEWQELGQSLKKIEGAVQFWIGDWARFGEKKGYYTDSKVYDQLEEITGLDHGTLKNYKSVSENVQSSLRHDDLSFSHHAEIAKLDPEKQKFFLNKAVEENLSVRDLREEIRKDTREYKIQQLPDGIFDLIYCDPPWKYDFSETDSRKIENQYPTMSVDEICMMGLPDINDNCLLLMWATAPKLKEALMVIEEWGFVYKTHSIWDKGKIGMGYWFRGQHELLLVATKGNFTPPIPEYRKSSIYQEDRETHSSKPEFYYEWIEKAFPNTNKIELFSRRERNGWAQWGNE